MTLLPSSPGQCLVCRKDISRKSAEIHLISHKKKKSPKPSAYLIEVTAQGHPEYWMYLSSLPDATLEDINPEEVMRFLRHMQDERRSEIDVTIPFEKALERLNLLSSGVPTNTAILMFAKDPHRFII